SEAARHGPGALVHGGGGRGRRRGEPHADPGDKAEGLGARPIRLRGGPAAGLARLSASGPRAYMPSTSTARENSSADSSMLAGKVSSQASRMMRTVPLCRPLRLATMVPATPEDSTWVVETGRLKTLATPMAATAVIWAAMPWA